MRESQKFPIIFTNSRIFRKKKKTSTMIPLETNRRVLTWLCVFPSEEGTSWHMKVAHIAFCSFVLGMNVVSCIVSVAFLLKYISNDMEQCLFAFVQICGEVNMSYIIIITYLLRHKITATYNSLADIYRTCKNIKLFFKTLYCKIHRE